MGKISSFPFIFLGMVLSMSLIVASSNARKQVPALYIFGDSIFDNGNNHFLPTHAQADYYPYGIDHPLGVTGRFTNGRIIPDFFAEWLGLGDQPAYLKVKNDPRIDKNHEGFNYASAAAGFLNDTGHQAGDTLCMKEQVELLRETVQQHLPKYFKNQQELATHLAKSIFIVAIGVNDIHLTLIKEENETTQYPRDPQQFNNMLIRELDKSLTALYELGARKFVVADFAAMGSFPGLDKRLNDYGQMFNAKLQPKLDELKSKLGGSIFTIFKLYNITYPIVNDPKYFGFSELTNSCCATNTSASPGCLPGGSVCKDRNTRLFFDAGHPTEAFYKIMATDCYTLNGCVPFNLKKLAKM